MFETERLLIRRFEGTDADAVATMRGDADVMRYIRQPQKPDEAAKWMRMVSERWETERIGLCALIEKRSGEFIGWCGLWILPETKEIEVGYAVAKRFWGAGYAAEAARAFLEYGFDELDLKKIVAVADPQNAKSRRVMEKLGMSYHKIGRFYGGELVQYLITKDEFNQNRKAAAA